MEFTATLLSLVWGALIGSFMNVVVLRLPRSEDIVFERSGCPKCKGKISWYDNIPIFSFAFLLGKCRNCQQKISWQYPLFEIWHALLAVYIFSSWITFSNSQWLEAISAFFIASIFSAHILIDLRHQLLLDKLNLALVPFVLVIVAINESWFDAGVGAVIGFGFPLNISRSVAS